MRDPIPVPPAPTAEAETARVTGLCLQQVSAEGTRYLPLHSVQELFVTAAQRTPTERERGWHIVAQLGDEKRLCLQAFGDDRDAAVAAAPAYAAQIFQAQEMRPRARTPERADPSYTDHDAPSFA